MRKKELYQKVIEYFQTAMPVAETELHYSNPFELLIAVILSAQCTDKRVNMITPPLFRDFPTPEALAATTPEVLFVLKMPFWAKKIQKQEILAFYKSLFSLK